MVKLFISGNLTILLKILHLKQGVIKMLEYEENMAEEKREYSPYSLGYDEEQSLNEIEYALNKGYFDDYELADFRDYLKYLRAKLTKIMDFERQEGNPLGDLPNYLSRVQDLLLEVVRKPVF